MIIRTTDNNGGRLISQLADKDIKEINIKDLNVIANKKLCNIKLEDNPDLLVFPQNWQLGIDSNDIVFELDGGNLTTGNIMGFIGYKGTSLTISSRFYSNGNDFFLHYMLSKIFGINVVNLKFSKGEESIHDFLPYLFPSYLQNALSQGLYKQYKRNQYNDANVKGVIDINRHIRINIPFAGKVAYTTREHSYDNSVTQLIRHTIEHLRTRNFGHSILTNNAETRANVSQIEYATPTYKKNYLQRIIKANLKLINHPYYTKYRDLQKLCLQILRQQKTNFGAKDKIHGLLFDGAWLWEEYINTLIGKDFWHPNNKKRIYPQRLFENLDENKKEGLIYPDFISKDASNRIIADAKYKPKENIRSDDYLQLLAYMFRFDSRLGYYIYPQDKSNIQNDDKLELLQGVTIKDNNEMSKAREHKIIISKYGLTIPQNMNLFKEFVEEIRKNENNLRKIF